MLTHFTGVSTVLNQPLTTTGSLLGIAANGPYPGVWCSVFTHGTTTLSPIYGSANTAVPNPFLVNLDGSYSFYGPNASYDLVFSTTVPLSSLVGPVQVPSYTLATLPAASTMLPGDLARITDGDGGLWMSNGVVWTAVGAATTHVSDITDYGAVGDGVTDNTLAIQAALDAVYAAGGGTVYVPAGTFICGALTYKSKVTLAGGGWGSILKTKNALNDGWIGPGTSADDCAFLNLAFDGNKANNSAGFMLYLNGQRSRVEGCSFSNGLLAVYFYGTIATKPNAGQALVAHNLFYNVGHDGYGAMAIVHGRHIDIRSNRFVADDGKMTYAIDIEPNGVGEAVHDIVIADNTIQGGRIFLDCASQASAGTNYSVTDNTIDARGSGLDYGFFDNCVPLYLRNLDGLTISGNVIYGRADSHRQMIEVGVGIAKFQITNNLVFCGKHASLTTIVINFPFSANAAVNGRITGNHFIGLTGAPDTAISSFHTSAFSNVVVGDNHLTNVTSPYIINTLDTERDGIRPISITGDYAVLNTAGPHVVIFADATSAPITVTPYDPASQRGQRLTVIKTDSSSNPVTINGQNWSSATSKTATSALLTSQHDTRTAMSDHSVWREVSRATKPYYTVNIKDYGARGDGTTDDTTAIQAALTAGAGGIVYIPVGVYICGIVVIPTATTVMGAGRGSVLKLKASTNSALLQVNSTSAYYDDLKILNLTVDGNKANNATGIGIQINGRRNVIDNCTIFDCGSYGISSGSPSGGVANIPEAGGWRITNNVITNCTVGIVIIHDTDVLIANNIIRSPDGDMTAAVQCVANTGNAVDTITVRDNVMVGAGINYDVHLLTAGYNISITGNHIDCRPFDGTIDATIVPIYLNKISGLHISGNTLIGHADGQTGGINVKGAIEKFQIVSNTIFASDYSGSSAGIRFDNSSGIATDGVIAHNVIIGLETVDYGIYTPHASGWSNVESFGNRFRSVTTHHYIGQTGLAIGPSSEWTRKTSWNSGSIATMTANIITGAMVGGVATTTKTFEGAAVGDWIHAAFKNLPANVLGMASVTAADTITLTLLNLSGGAVTFNDEIRMVLRKYAANEATGVY